MGQKLTLDEVQVDPKDAAQVIYDLRRTVRRQEAMLYLYRRDKYNMLASESPPLADESSREDAPFNEVTLVFPTVEKGATPEEDDIIGTTIFRVEFEGTPEEFMDDLTRETSAGVTIVHVEKLAGKEYNG